MTFRDIGVAIGIPEPYRTELQGRRERLGDPNAPLIIPQVTLLGPTVLPHRELPAVEGHLAAVAADGMPFHIRLCGSGSFRPLSPVVFVTLAMGISCCTALAARVRSGPLERPLRFAYHPHVTVVRDIDDDRLDRAAEQLAGYRAEFDVPGFSLYERGDDQAWRELRFFPFGRPARRAPGNPRGRRLAEVKPMSSRGTPAV
jgi:2'-5' RNA ligase